MGYSFEYIDIILLAMIAGFIFLRLRGILGKRTGFEGKTNPAFEKVLKDVKVNKVLNTNAPISEPVGPETIVFFLLCILWHMIF